MPDRLPTPILDTIESPQDLRTKSIEELEQLCHEIRGELIHIIKKNGGHLASNLGVVELTVAMLAVFEFPSDKLIFDVSHQCYVYKLLTGRRKEMENLRQHNGCSGFQMRSESQYDCFGGGHAGIAISAGLGFAAARDLSNKKENIIAFVGDAALGCGVAFEGINNISTTTKNFIIVLNDNKQSIAPNVGALSNYLNTIILGEAYNRVHSSVNKLLLSIPIIGKPLKKFISASITNIRHFLMPPGRIFNDLGLRYFGPVDGHNLRKLIATFKNMKDFRNSPIILHTITQKGKGYEAAENNPEVYHGVSTFDKLEGEFKKSSGSFSHYLGTSLFQAMQENNDVVAITAATCAGNGIIAIRETYKDRYYDVGIAEEHALVFAAGLAAGGKIPVVPLYASFVQRAFDYVFHDICLQNLPVIVCLDRAEVVSDGPTHHGIYDLSFWRSMPNLSILQPADGEELEAMLKLAIAKRSPTIIRYPNANAKSIPQNNKHELTWGKATQLRDGKDGTIWACGREVEIAIKVADLLLEKNIELGIVNPRFVAPLDNELLIKNATNSTIITIDNHTKNGGFSDFIREHLENTKTTQYHYGWENTIIGWGDKNVLRKRHQMSAEQIANDLEQKLK